MWKTSRYRRAEARKDMLDREVDRVPERDLRAFYEDLTERTKDPDTFAVLSWCLIGIQHFYLKDATRGVLVILAYVIGVMTAAFGIGVFVLLFVVLYEIGQCMQSQAIVMEYNNRIKEALIKRYTPAREPVLGHA